LSSSACDQARCHTHQPPFTNHHSPTRTIIVIAIIITIHRSPIIITIII
jgi:hypothetical protein